MFDRCRYLALIFDRCRYLALIAVVCASEAGCCCDCWPCGKTWCGRQCGEFYWHEWFSHKPDCCEPCDRCGNYTGETKQSDYSTGGARRAPATAGPAQEYNPESAEPTPAEELPSGEPTAADYTNEFGQVVSYQTPVDSPNNSRKLGKPRRANDSAR